MNFIKRFYKSLYDFEKYNQLVKQSFFSAVLNVFVLSVFVVVLLSVPFLIQYFKLGGITGAIDKYVPDFSLKNGVLTTDKVYKKEVEKFSLIILDTKNPHVEQELVSYESGFIASKDKIIIKSLSGDTISQSYKMYEDFGIINKAAVFKLVPFIKIYLIFFCLMFLCFIFIQHMFYAFIFATIANIINLYVRAKLKLPDIFKLTCYAMSMPVLFKNIITSFNLLINTKIGFYMPMLVYFGLVGVYCYFILKAIKDGEEKNNTNRKRALL